MNDIYSPPEADIQVPQDVESPTFLKSLGGFIVSLLAVNVLNYIAGVLHAALEPVDSSPTVTLYTSVILSTAINLGWIIAWPRYCRQQNWPNLHRGALWHRVFIIAVLGFGFVALLVLTVG